jgi:hypothetical protein
VEEWVAAQAGRAVDEAALEELRREVGAVSEGYLRRILIGAGARLAPEVEGVRLDNFAELERTLRRLQESYETGVSAAARAKLRRIVLAGRRRAEWVAERSKDERKRREKAEMVAWLRVWLENPAVFSAWVESRKRVIAAQPSPPE